MKKRIAILSLILVPLCLLPPPESAAAQRVPKPAEAGAAGAPDAAKPNLGQRLAGLDRHDMLTMAGHFLLAAMFVSLFTLAMWRLVTRTRRRNTGREAFRHGVEAAAYMLLVVALLL